MSTSTADSEVRAAFRAMLSAERAGYKLAVALVSTLVSYLVGTAELSDVSELDMSTLLTTAAEAWAATHEGEDLPNVHRSRLERWIANVPATIAVDGDAPLRIEMSQCHWSARAKGRDVKQRCLSYSCAGCAAAICVRRPHVR